MDGELAEDGPAWNLGLKRLVEVVVDEGAAAIGTLLGEGSFEGFIDLLGRRRGAMTMPAVFFALLAARFFRVLLGLAFGKRSGWPLGRAFDFFKAFVEIANGLPERGILFAELLIFAEQMLVGRRVHADLDGEIPCQLSGIIGVLAVIGKGSLNKHVFSSSVCGYNFRTRT